MRARRFFEKGVLRFVILDLLANKPSHGYEIIHNLEDIFHGFYSPSPGSIYPTLQLLQKQGYVTPDVSSGKKVYTVTDTGLTYLSEHTDIVKGLRQCTKSKHRPKWLHADFRATAAELRLLGQSFVQHAPDMNRDQMEHVRKIIQQAISEIRNVIGSLPDGKAH